MNTWPTARQRAVVVECQEEDGQGLACLWVHVSLQGFPPERVVIAVEGVNDSILMDKGGVEAGMGCGSPLSRPAGESVFTGNGLTVRH